MSKAQLAQVLGGVDIPVHPSLLVGVETLDDAGVVRLNDTTALVQTVDIFPPVVDDPYWFGRIAAANSLSDVYAMGGRPVSAVNFVGYPMSDLGPEPLQQILKGSFDALEEADCAMAGGHSIADNELKFGLAVTGTVHPDRFLRNATARPGDRLVLTKPLGMGCLTTAIKQEAATEEHIHAAYRCMARLNRQAAEAMLRANAHACTDITGFGLLGHAVEMAEGAGLTLRIQASQVPILEESRPYLSDRYVCGGSKRNRAWTESRVRYGRELDPIEAIVLDDVQTSGGLLVAVPADSCDGFLADLRAGGDVQAADVGEVLDSDAAVEVV